MRKKVSRIKKPAKCLYETMKLSQISQISCFWIFAKIKFRLISKLFFESFLLLGTKIELTLSWRGPLSYKKRANQWTGFYMITASVMKELSWIRFHAFLSKLNKNTRNLMQKCRYFLSFQDPRLFQL